jgi:hypothetical protein
MLEHFVDDGIRNFRAVPLTKIIFAQKHLGIVTVAEKS